MATMDAMPQPTAAERGSTADESATDPFSASFQQVEASHIGRTQNVERELASVPEVPTSDPNRPNGNAPTEKVHGSANSGTVNAAQAHGTTSPGNSSPVAQARKRMDGADVRTPPRRRSVQFARGGTTGNGDAGMPVGRAATQLHDEDAEREGKESFFSKLKNLATPTSSSQIRGPNAHTEPGLAPAGNHAALPTEAVEAVEMGTEADEEDSSEEEAEGEDHTTSQASNATSQSRPKQRRRYRRPAASGSDSLPTTPKQSRFASFIKDHPLPGSSTHRPTATRRATMSDVDATDSHPHNGGVSEDEGRDRLRNALRRGLEGARGLSYNPRRHAESGEGTPDGRRPGAMRRFTGFGGRERGDSPTATRGPMERNFTSSAQKWRQVKAGLRMLGQRKKEERMRVDHQKSAQLMAELLAGAPAALFFASMFQRDEHKHRKVPVLLEQLKISIPDVRANTDKKGDRDFVFRIDLEYGNGPARMQWTIHRSVNDFVNLHVKYKAQGATEKVRHLRSDDKSKPKIPRFPKSVIPYARSMRGLFEKVEDEEEEPTTTALSSAAVINAAGGDPADTAGRPPNVSRPSRHHRRISSFAAPRRTYTDELGNTSLDPEALTARQRQMYAERSRQKLEIYLQQMIRWLIFRPDSTRLCKFLEISAMAIRLSAEGGYQGKQGLLQIASRRHIELNKRTLESFSPAALKERHKRRWFLVRHSYIICVDGPDSLTPYDVFLVDSDFAIEKKKKVIHDSPTAEEATKVVTKGSKTAKKAHLIRLYNAERKLKLYARNEKQYLQFKESLAHMMKTTIWSKKHRFASFAPVRNDVWARWLVDGRDHMWQVSRAIDNAKDLIYIHDWWLSPELYLRRPAAISQKWRLDRLLQRKAEEGVKIFVIIYRNIESAIPIDSEYTKWSLLDLHPNICVQRSPNQFRQNQFFWAHHEKLVVVDNMMAFLGGVDLCFGRWDDPCHSLVDDKLTGFEDDMVGPRDSEHCQLWPGKDYSNPRVQDFYELSEPFEEMYDRSRVPRMPWHDISMQLVGQPARDVARHFVQRWNYVLRSRIPSRPTPVLMPPPEYDQSELEDLGMTGTCQVQVLRSCSPWSIGTPNKVEHSIMNAYCSMIEASEHFVYVENQFYISSTVVEGTRIHNKIGDALVERAIRAHENNETWLACLVIPLMPGFQNSVDSPDGTSVRLIMSCQYRSINRGEDSIWGRLSARGINPEDYIRFYSLRQWGKIGPRKCLTTEQLYIHAKCMIVDDRTAIIGSANINERSMLGSRDSEVAAIITDTHMLPSFMGGKPYEVGDFPHTLRMRLQREHLGIDVDALYRREQAEAERAMQDAEMERIYGSTGYEPKTDYFEAVTPPVPTATSAVSPFANNAAASTRTSESQTVVAGQSNGDARSSNSSDGIDRTNTAATEHRREVQHDLDVEGLGFDNMKKLVEHGNDGYRDSYVDDHGREVLLKSNAPDVERIRQQYESDAQQQEVEKREAPSSTVRPPWPTGRLETYAMGLAPRSQLPELPSLDDTDIGGPPLTQGPSATSSKSVSPMISNMRRPEVHEDCMKDPIANTFYHDIWHQVAENNTKLYRMVFRCMPDSEVTDYNMYRRYNEYHERFMESQGLGSSKPVPSKNAPGQSGPPGSVGTDFVTAAAQKAMEGKSPSRNALGGIVGKLRPTSKQSTAPSNIENEKSHDEEEHNEKDAPRSLAPGSPMSGVSSVPTAVPSPLQIPIDEKEAAKQQDDEQRSEDQANGSGSGVTHPSRARALLFPDTVNQAPETTATQSLPTGTLSASATGSQKKSAAARKRAATGKSAGGRDEVLSKEEAEEVLKLIQGHLVTFPYDWLEKEERGGKWLYNIDQLAPLEIYD